ncbi:MAG TPA: glycosyltransferase family 87 protein [Bdellovibrionota bacterium]|nr:glycosyltransferase family 87 protein [Bdellovibrionota bacterium]
MSRPDRPIIPRELAILALATSAVLTAVGTAWAFQRGGRDFDVFFHACSLVLSGKGSMVYASSPDRFLYAPGFAWIFSPLALLPRDFALALWCFAKAGAIGWMIRSLGRFLLPAAHRMDSMGAAALGLILVARPVLIDFEYGQVNVFIVAACVWALLSLFEEERGERETLAAWAVLAFAAVAKVFPLPLLAVPFLVGGMPRQKLKAARTGALAGFFAMILVPALGPGLGGLPPLYAGWKSALLSKGLPLESHNQSFIAFLHHYFSGRPTHVISQGWVPLRFGMPVFESSQLTLLSLSWTASTAGLLLAWLLRGPAGAPARWASVFVALLVLPSHLVWKPYFVTAFPLAAWHVSRQSAWPLLAAVFVAVNLTGFDFVGHGVAARLEAASILLFAQLALVAWALLRRR